MEKNAERNLDIRGLRKFSEESSSSKKYDGAFVLYLCQVGFILSVFREPREVEFKCVFYKMCFPRNVFPMDTRELFIPSSARFHVLDKFS